MTIVTEAPVAKAAAPVADPFLLNAGPVGSEIRSFRWDSTPLGPWAGWPVSLRTAIEIVVAGGFPMILLWGRELIVCAYNSAYESLLAGRGRPLGQPFLEVWSEARDIIAPQLEASLAGETLRYHDAEFTLLNHGQPERVSFDYCFCPLRDESGAVIGVLNTAVPTTERIRAQQQLRRNHDTFYNLIQNNPFGVYVVDSDFLLRQVSVGAQKVFSGIRPLLGRDFAEVLRLVWSEPFATEAIDRFRHTLATGEPYISPSTVAERFDLQRSEAYDWRIERIVLPDGHYGVVCNFYDLSERKQWEAALNESEQRLRDANRRKDEFLATLAHELRNPLAPLKNGLHIARLSSKPDSTLGRTVEMMNRQLNHLVRLVDDLLDIGRISAGKVEIDSKLVSIRDVLARSIEASQTTIDSHGHRLAVEIGSEDLLVDGDMDRLAQVFSNLLLNAAKYTEPGGQIRLVASHEGDEIVVSVIDTGIGIPREELPNVFALFSQVRSHQGHWEGGLGIGLALVRSLTTLHGGSVTAESEGPGKGSTFTVRLPSATTSSSAGRGPHDAVTHAVGVTQRRILIADDALDSAESLAALLSLDGHEVMIANDGIEAVQRFGTFRPHVVILDLGMPRMDGLEAARRTRASPSGRRVTLLALTGWGQAADRERTREAGFDAHFVKPVNLAVLEQVLAAKPSL